MRWTTGDQVVGPQEGGVVVLVLEAQVEVEEEEEEGVDKEIAEDTPMQDG